MRTARIGRLSIARFIYSIMMSVSSNSETLEVRKSKPGMRRVFRYNLREARREIYAVNSTMVGFVSLILPGTHLISKNRGSR
jgi:hypothetical protein